MSADSAIDIFLRLRPTQKQIKEVSISEDKTEIELRSLRSMISKETKDAFINNTKDSATFKFNRIFDGTAKQEDIFEAIGREAADSSLEGFNSTIFAYGQTGSGKTFTMTGGTDSYHQRGLIPRIISYLFDRAKSTTEKEITLSMSYFEIYNNDGYDLLHKGQEGNRSQLRDLPRIQPFETTDNHLVLKGLSVHKTENEEDAFNILFVGDTNRVICETPLNDASTRSHCIFTVIIESRPTNSELKTISRLNLVDLSGSERVGRTQVGGKLLKEACSINLSLHYLEHVIICLQKKMKGENVFVPFRNSLMTLVLKDSLGGNCKTKMISTVLLEEWSVMESLTTCNFAQRVALIQNKVSKNEAVDTRILIARLKGENDLLKKELELLRGNQPIGLELDPQKTEMCEKLVENFLSKEDSNDLMIVNDKLVLRKCLLFIKNRFFKMIENGTTKQIAPLSNNFLEDQNQNVFNSSQALVTKNQSGLLNQNKKFEELNDQISELKTLLGQRDNEIRALTGLLNSKETKVEVLEEESRPIKFAVAEKTDYPKPDASMIEPDSVNKTISAIGEERPSFRNDNYVEKSLDDIEFEKSNIPQKNFISSCFDPKDPQKSFERYRKTHRLDQVIKENLLTLKELYEKGQILSKKVKVGQNQIDSLKQSIESIRKANLYKNYNQVYTGDVQSSSEEQELVRRIALLKKEHEGLFDQMRQTKADIERLQSLLERNKRDLKRDFEEWYENQVRVYNSDDSSVHSRMTSIYSNMEEFTEFKKMAEKSFASK